MMLAQSSRIFFAKVKMSPSGSEGSPYPCGGWRRECSSSSQSHMHCCSCLCFMSGSARAGNCSGREASEWCCKIPSPSEETWRELFSDTVQSPANFRDRNNLLKNNRFIGQKPSPSPAAFLHAPKILYLHWCAEHYYGSCKRPSKTIMTKISSTELVTVSGNT